MTSDIEGARMALALRGFGLTDEQVRRIRHDEGDWLANVTPKPADSRTAEETLARALDVALVSAGRTQAEQDAPRILAALSEAGYRIVSDRQVREMGAAALEQARLAVAAAGRLIARRPPDDLRDFAEDVIRQFGYWSDTAGGYMTGGLSTLERAFAILGWDDPHPDTYARCDEPGCLRQSSVGTPTMAGYRRTCHDHAPVGLTAEQRAAWRDYSLAHPGATFDTWARRDA